MNYTAVLNGLKLIANVARTFIKKHSGKIAIGSLVMAASGSTTSIYSNCKNKSAIELVDIVVQNYNDTKEKTLNEFDRLGSVKLQVYSSFDNFTTLIEKIKDPPSNLKKGIAKIELSNYDYSQIKRLDANMQTVIAAGAGSLSGAAIGVALFGISEFALVPMAAMSSFFVCVKGFSLLDKSIQNMKQAEILSAEIDGEIGYLNSLFTCAYKLRKTIQATSKAYLEHINLMKLFLANDLEWSSLSEEKKLLIRNTIMLTKLLKDMCDLELVCVSDETGNKQILSNKVEYFENHTKQVLSKLEEKNIEKSGNDTDRKKHTISSNYKKQRLGRIHKKSNTKIDGNNSLSTIKKQRLGKVHRKPTNGNSSK